MKIKLEKEQLSILFLLIIGLIVIGIQNSYVGMYYDDYGNASLSYGMTVANVEGTKYTFSQLMEWALNCYLNWGGRILYAVTFIIPLLKNGINAFMNLQSLIVILICTVSYKIICHYTEKKFAISSILMLYMFYGLIGISTHKHGTYWASASVLYLWPLLPLLLSFFLYMKTCEKIKAGEKVSYLKLLPVLIVILFFAACSQEQVGLSVIVYFIFYIGFDHLKGWKKYLKLDFTVIITSLISYIILFCSPGNFIRLSGNSEFAQLGFFEKLAFNMPRVLNCFFIKDMTIFNLLLLVGMFIIAIYLMNKKRTYIIFFLTTLVISLIYLGLLAGIIKLPFLILNCFYLMFLINIVVMSLCYFYQTERMAVNALVIAGGASVFCLLYSPSILERSYIEYIFIVFILLSILFIDCYRRYSFYSLFRMGAVIILILLCIKSALNFKNILSGYKQNAYALNYNHQRFLDYSDQEGNTIFLAKLPNDTYRGEMPYDFGFEYMEYWFKEYYNIPQDVTFQWGQLEVGRYLQIDGDFFEDGWFGKEGNLTVNGKRVNQIGLSCYIPDNAPTENQLICTIGDEEIVFDVKRGSNQFVLDLFNYASDEIHVKIEAQSTYNYNDLGISTEARDLSMKLSIYQK